MDVPYNYLENEKNAFELLAKVKITSNHKKISFVYEQKLHLLVFNWSKVKKKGEMVL